MMTGTGLLAPDSMERPLLIYEDGRFKADRLPDWYIQYIKAGTGDVDELLERIGFKRAEYITEVETHNVMEVSVYRRGDIFYAICSDWERQLWQATFGWEDWPGFFAQFVVPATVASNLCAL